jgi:hypothetical protein
VHLSISSNRPSGPIGLAALAALLFVALAGSAAAELETLAPETAAEVVAATKGVVVVDLFADW